MRVDAGFPSTINVTQHNAPTADSARLYGEMLDRARAEVLETVKVDGNVLGSVVRYRRHDEMRDVFVFELNGQRYTVPVSDNRADRLCDALARVLAPVLLAAWPLPATPERAKEGA